MKKYLLLTLILVNASVLAETKHIGALAKLDNQNKNQLLFNIVEGGKNGETNAI